LKHALSNIGYAVVMVNLDYWQNTQIAYVTKCWACACTGWLKKSKLLTQYNSLLFWATLYICGLRRIADHCTTAETLIGLILNYPTVNLIPLFAEIFRKFLEMLANPGRNNIYNFNSNSLIFLGNKVIFLNTLAHKVKE